MNITKKILIAVIVIILIIAVVTGIIIVINSIKDEEELPDGPSHRESISAEIIEINADDTIIVKCTKERTQLVKKDEKVKLKVGQIYACISETGEDISEKYEMQVDDIINIGFWKEELEIQNDQHYIDLEKNGIILEVYFEDYETRTFL